MKTDREVPGCEEALAVNSLIQELNTLFQGSSQTIVDQESFVERIDYNVEQSSIQDSKFVEHVFKMERYQRGNKKIHLVFCLTVVIIFVFISIIVADL
ncbi:unnamed protein product [Caenorhabditis nigoni]|uniref:t-SNARE coiled-coil homology domain-containing protein n=1 Tax=Caenorhabditis nigoni TaxID=1611254 RepID=A0A2G5SFF2_9PELO|nr:hypothetical protein B9Z55_027706 [Caenorhabditis nigoni]